MLSFSRVFTRRQVTARPVSVEYLESPYMFPAAKQYVTSFVLHDAQVANPPLSRPRTQHNALESITEEVVTDLLDENHSLEGPYYGPLGLVVRTSLPHPRVPAVTRVRMYGWI